MSEVHKISCLLFTTSPKIGKNGLKWPQIKKWYKTDPNWNLIFHSLSNFLTVYNVHKLRNCKVVDFWSWRVGEVSGNTVYHATPCLHYIFIFSALNAWLPKAFVKLSNVFGCRNPSVEARSPSFSCTIAKGPSTKSHGPAMEKWSGL